MSTKGKVFWRDLARRFRNVWRDLRYGKILGGRQKHQAYADRGAYGFNNTDYGVLAQMFSGLVSADDILVDVGCGRGRVLNYWLEAFPRNRIVGIELDPEYAESTRSRLRRYPQVKVVSGDAVENLPLDGSIYYLFNPFDAENVRRFVAKLIEDHPALEKVRVVYYAPEHLDVLGDFPGLDIQSRQVELGNVKSYASRHVRYALIRFKPPRV